MLERISSIAAIVACVAVVAHVGSLQYETRANRPDTAYVKGDRIANTSELSLDKSPLTLVVGTVSTCKFCTASMEFYKQAVSVADEGGVRVIAVTNEDVHANRKYLDDHGVKVDAVVSAAENRINIHSTPTLLLVRATGEIDHAWVGQLDKDGEEEVIRLVSTANATRRQE